MRKGKVRWLRCHGGECGTGWGGVEHGTGLVAVDDGLGLVAETWWCRWLATRWRGVVGILRN